MIFLAVTLGFFAESYREYLSDRRKERDLVVTIFKQIQSDSTRLEYLIYSYFPKYLNYVDTVGWLLKKGDINTNEKPLIVSLFNTTNWDWFIPEVSGINQMKNAESLFQNTNALNALLQYNEFIDSYSQISQFTYAMRDATDTSLASVMDYKTELFLNNKMINRFSTLKTSFCTINDLPPYASLVTVDTAKLQIHYSKIKQTAIMQGDMDGMYNLLYYKALLHCRFKKRISLFIEERK